MTTETRKLLIEIYKADVSGGWNNHVPTYEVITSETRGNLTQLKKLGLAKTTNDEGIDWIVLTEEGINKAKELI